jgi:hypothetical protein
MTDEINELKKRLDEDDTPITRKIVKSKFINFINYLNTHPSVRTSLSTITLHHIKLLGIGWRMPYDTLDFYYKLKDDHHGYINNECTTDVVWMEYLVIFQKFRVMLMTKYHRQNQ